MVASEPPCRHCAGHDRSPMAAVTGVGSPRQDGAPSQLEASWCSAQSRAPVRGSLGVPQSSLPMYLHNRVTVIQRRGSQRGVLGVQTVSISSAIQAGAISGRQTGAAALRNLLGPLVIRGRSTSEWSMVVDIISSHVGHGLSAGERSGGAGEDHVRSGIHMLSFHGVQLGGRGTRSVARLAPAP
jgi:hypothetical protein